MQHFKPLFFTKYCCSPGIFANPFTCDSPDFTRSTPHLMWHVLIVSECDGEYQYNQEYIGGEVVDVPDDQTFLQTYKNETCHSLCENQEDCVAWTWTAAGKCRLTGMETPLETTQSKPGSFSGFKNSCKPSKYICIKWQNLQRFLNYSKWLYFEPKLHPFLIIVNYVWFVVRIIWKFY